MRREVLNALSRKKGQLILTRAFQAVTFYDEKAERQVIVLYSLGEDGIIREFCNNKWQAYPVTEGVSDKPI